jgi:hypothetical protein
MRVACGTSPADDLTDPAAVVFAIDAVNSLAVIATLLMRSITAQAGKPAARTRREVRPIYDQLRSNVAQRA